MAITSEQLLSTCKVFVEDVDSIFHNEGETNPMDIMRQAGADTFCNCVEAEIVEIEPNMMGEVKRPRNAVTRYMAFQIAKAREEVSGSPKMSDAMGFGNRVDNCLREAGS